MQGATRRAAAALSTSAAAAAVAVAVAAAPAIAAAVAVVASSSVTAALVAQDPDGCGRADCSRRRGFAVAAGDMAWLAWLGLDRLDLATFS